MHIRYTKVGQKISVHCA